MLIPTAPKDRFELLRILVRSHMTAEGAADAYEAMLLKLQKDTVTCDRKGETVTMLGFERAPAAKGNHHAYEGGLTQHLLEMWSTWLVWSSHWDIKDPLFVSDDLVLRAIINHDLHKSHRTFGLVNEDPWEVRYVDDLTDMLMTSDVKTMWMLNEFNIPMDARLYNALIQAEGGYSKIVPKWGSVLAKICYLLDEWSGNVISRAEDGTWLNVREKSGPGKREQRQQLGRSILGAAELGVPTEAGRTGTS